MVKRSKGRRPPVQKVWTQQYLRQWRNHRSWSGALLAEKSGVSEGQINQIENGESAGSPESLEKLAAALGITVGELLDVNPEGNGAMFRVWVPDSQRDQVARIVAAIIEKP